MQWNVPFYYFWMTSRSNNIIIVIRIINVLNYWQVITKTKPQKTTISLKTCWLKVWDTYQKWKEEGLSRSGQTFFMSGIRSWEKRHTKKDLLYTLKQGSFWVAKGVKY